MDTTHLCPSCGKPLAPNAPQGICPECLMKAGFPTGSQAGPGGPAQPKSAGFVPPKPEELAPHFPQLEILELLGQGGMGAVYKAKQKGLDRLVALKVLPPETAGSPSFAERFTREARAMARLNHPNIVAVYDFGQVSGTGVPPVSSVGQASSLSSSPATGTASATATGGTPVPLFYFLMEFVDGVNLRQMLQAHRLSPREAMAIVPQICDALQYAHDQGIVHRDIKPENVLVDKQGRVKIADFGLAKLLGKDPQGERLTRSAEVMGTPQYMAPEQLEKPLEVDHRADIYSLGVVFYEMLTGELPLGRFGAPSSRMHGVQIDVRLDEVVLRALEKEPERRYQQASVLKTEVETIATTTSSSPQRSAAATAEETLIIHRAKWLLVPPAIALLTVAILETLLFLGAAFLGGMAFGKAPEFRGRPLAPFELSLFRGTVVVCVVWALLNMVSMFAAIRLMKLRSYGLGVAVAVLCFVPLDLIPLRMIVGVWLLIILSLKKTRVAFDLVKAQGASIRVTPPVNSVSAQAEPPVPPTPTGLEEARRQIKGPAIGLLVTGILNWVLIVGSMLLIAWYVSARSIPAGKWEQPIVLCVALSTLVLCSFIIYAAMKLMRLEGYRAGIIASVLAMIASPGNIIGLPIGIWALVVLMRKEVREAFRPTHRAAPPLSEVGSKVAGVIRWTARVLGTLMFLLLAVFVIAEGTPAIPNQPVGVQIEFVGFFFMALGFLVGWKWEGWAALSILAGVTIFHVVEGKILLPGALEAPAIVGVLYGLCWWMERRPPLRLPVTGTWSQVFKSTGVRLLLLVVVHLALFETLNQASVHWKESTGELCLMVLAAGSLAGLVWVFWPGYRLRGSILGVAGGSITCALLLLALDNFYFWQVRPALGLYQEPDWVAQHPGFQQELRQRIGMGNPAKPNVPRNRQPTVRSESLSDCVVHGIVTDAATGKPIIGARVVNNLFRGQPNQKAQEMVTDSDGRFELHTTGYEEHLVTASAPGYESNSCGLAPGTFERNTEVAINIQMRPRKASSTQSSTPLSFGPVIEQFLKAPEQRVAELLDLDTGQRATSTTFGEDDRETHDWIRAHHLDVLGVVEKGQIAVLCFDMAVLPVETNQWITATAASVTTNWALAQMEPNKITGISPVTDKTDTWFFRTREDGMGMLQITGLNDNPRGVKIHYKLVAPQVDKVETKERK